MSKVVTINHVTHYTYDRLISLGPQIIRLRPAPHTRTKIQSYSLSILPDKYFINWQQDPFANYLARIVIPDKTREFRVEVDLVAEMRVFNPFDFFIEESAKTFPFNYDLELKNELLPYLEIKDKGPLLMDFLRLIDRTSVNVMDFLVEINSKINTLLEYKIRLEPGVQNSDETLHLKQGSCRDMAWLLCQILRHLGLATRFVSGYLIQLKADIKVLDGPSGPEEDFTDLHAWTEVYLPGAGWVGLDPTSGLLAGEGHLPLCGTPNPSSAAPITGSIDACESELNHRMTITRIYEDRRVTKPYTTAEWILIDELGKKVDASLNAQNIALTMGGEPTFVSTANPEGDEWKYTALSQNKFELGIILLQRLKQKFAINGLLQISLGKWYPNEVLPRWAMQCYWRKDNEKILQNPGVIANYQAKYDYTLQCAKRFIEHLAKRLGIPKQYVLAAREDTPYFLWQEQRIPIASDMLSADVTDKDERKRLQTLIDKNLNVEVGYVLPLQHSATRQTWISNRWQLTIGDSPIGLRLPLKSLPYHLSTNQEFHSPKSVFDQKTKLPTYEQLQNNFLQKRVSDELFKDDPNGLIKNALCVEIREGFMYVFLPPCSVIEHYLELVAAIELTAESLDMPVVLEGYSPPKDLRINGFNITPDPGVLEVNIQPASNWDELKFIINTLYEEARLSGLTTDKFLMDGRRVGTGGGNHIVIGAKTPEASPFFKRPDVLKSLITFWQNHPALSYLFSSMYIGPTSQAPRIDEARLDSLYELEIAFMQIPEFANVQPWLVDRLLRNILVDLSGNTHRAEFCIDKLYNPEGDFGRLGLLEMRGFEMTPHPQMNLLQALLIRACIAAFWKEPYKGRLIRFGAELHDKYMLPYYVEEDLTHVLHYLNKCGFTFDIEWFKPFMDFRFPKYGSVSVGSLELELRMALEPWPVMGEEMYAGSVSRAVDSTVERLQVRVSGDITDRYVITCNGIELPLQNSQINSVKIAGVRYKAWSQSSSLHPTIPVHTPLVFDVVDKYYERSLGGCSYHVMHPGGRNYDNLPVNENAAEGRMISRFQSLKHSPGKRKVITQKINAEFPYTLDLRMHSKC